MLNDSPTRPVLLSPAPCVEMAGRRVAILMACYNGARHVEEQIRSIQSQIFTDWTLVVRDDGSRDGTDEIILRLGQDDARIILLQEGAGNLGASGNFSALMSHALEQGADYVFFADQDDVWHADKLAIMLGAMRELEVADGDRLPLLVHCDLAVVDEEKRMIAPSFMEYMKLSPEQAGLGVLLGQNQVTGCACLVNRAALELACPVPSGALMHDWWLALLCAATGRIGYVVQPLVEYRQHAANVVGAKSYWGRLSKFMFSLDLWRVQMATIRRSIRQASLVRERIVSRAAHSHPGALEQLAAYASLFAIASLKRLAVLKAYGIRKPVFLTDVFFKLLLVMQRNDGK